ncbi:stage IV sporulation protein B [Clostridium sp. CAG:780]|nr:stage IV sporulation protein B [Clostridium sp. CAG:780]
MRKNFAKIAVVLVLLLSYVYICSINSIPSNIIIFEGENLNLKIATGLTLASKNSKTILTASNINKEKINSEGTNNLNLNLFGTIPVKEVNVNVIPKTMVVPLGNAIGMKLYTKGVLVVGMSQIETDKNEKKKPYENSGIEQGDTILEINNNIVGNTEELIKEVENSKGNTINIKYLRDDKTMQTDITPVKSKNTYKIGLWVRDAAAGVGTLTFYEPSTNLFMALGHGISDIDTEEIVNIANGELVTANIVSITKGRKGYPGEIRGTIDEGKTIGTIYKNTNFGVYGMVKNKNYLEADLTQEMEVAPRNEIKEGKAQIICQLENSAKKKYDIEIEKVYINNNQNNKSMLIKITDKELLEKTGGIIQGMSGAPIIQEGKFVGAVTNVLVNDPTQGYGVFADIMIKEMRSI